VYKRLYIEEYMGISSNDSACLYQMKLQKLKKTEANLLLAPQLQRPSGV
jgi:hypothetical protein